MGNDLSCCHCSQDLLNRQEIVNPNYLYEDQPKRRYFLPRNLRLAIYSYCGTSVILNKLAYLSMQERKNILASEMIGKR